MGQALYRKYRSKNLDELVGQQHITDTLKRALDGGRISHAYLFTGPRGIGKTSTARILAHAINDLPYDETQTHMDIIEIDAASNRRIDEIRDIRDRVYIAPTAAKYKVYIIDEVHMLTKEAFNALLKTLEEPPAHVVFILATTEAHKLPATIISRTQRYVFRPADQSAVVAHLKEIAAAEKMTIDDDALGLIAAYGQGSFRDSISLLDQAGSGGQPVSLQTIQELLGVASDAAIADIMRHIAQHDALAIVETLNQLYSAGHNASQLAAQLGEAVRKDFLEAKTFASDTSLAALAGLLEVPASRNPERALELVLLLAATTPQSAQPVAAPPVKAVPTAVHAAAPPAPAVARPAPVAAEPTVKPAPTAAEPIEEDTFKGGDVFDMEQWPAILEAFRQKYNTLYSILNKATPNMTDGKLELCVDFPFHQKRLNENKNKQIIFDTIKQVTGLNVSFSCTVKPKAAAPAPAVEKTAPKKDEDDIKTVSNIFGGGEMLS